MSKRRTVLIGMVAGSAVAIALLPGMMSSAADDGFTSCPSPPPPTESTEPASTTATTELAASSSTELVLNSLPEDSSPGTALGVRTSTNRVAAQPAPPPAAVYKFKFDVLNLNFFEVASGEACGLKFVMEKNGPAGVRGKWALYVNDVPAGQVCTAEIHVIDPDGNRAPVKNLKIRRLKTLTPDGKPAPETTHLIEFEHPDDAVDGGKVEVRLVCRPDPTANK
jgi:hypothetical protein